MKTPRVVTMLPSATEIVHALGLTSSLLGRSHECDFPAGVEALPEVTYAHIDATAPSADIDRSVKERVASGASIYGIHEDLLSKLNPDVVITQTQCEVCAVSLSDVKAYFCQVNKTDTQLVVLEPNHLEDVWKDILKVADALGVTSRGEEVVADLRRQMASIASRTRPLRSPRIALVEWIDPLMAGGNWMPELVRLAGGHGLFGKSGEHSPWITWEQLHAEQPELVIVAPCGFDLERTEKEMAGFKGLQQLEAFQRGKVFITDGNAFFNRPGPRLLESLEILCEIIHPEHFDFGHHGKGWKRYVDNTLLPSACK